MSEISTIEGPILECDEPIIGPPLEPIEETFNEFKEWAVFIYHLSIQIDRMYNDESDKLRVVNKFLSKIDRVSNLDTIWLIKRVKKVTNKNELLLILQDNIH